MSWTPMEDPMVMKIAAAHGVTPAQVLLQWQYALGIPTNPRSQHAGHMRENLQSYTFTLTDDEMKSLMSGAQDVCVENPGWSDGFNCCRSPSVPQVSALTLPLCRLLCCRYECVNSTSLAARKMRVASQ